MTGRDGFDCPLRIGIEHAHALAERRLVLGDSINSKVNPARSVDQLHRIALALVRDAEIDERLGHLRRDALELRDRRVDVAVGEIDHRDVVRDLVGADARVRIARRVQEPPRLTVLSRAIRVLRGFERDMHDARAFLQSGTQVLTETWSLALPPE